MLKNDQAISKNLVLFTLEGIQSMFDHFLTLCMKELNPSKQDQITLNLVKCRKRCYTDFSGSKKISPNGKIGEGYI